MVGYSLASWLSECISDAERAWRMAVDNGDKTKAAYLLGAVNTLSEIEDCIANQDSCPGPGKCTDQGCPAHYASEEK